MKHTDIINIELKSNFINDLFEAYEVDVTYQYDRTYEGMEDEYQAIIPEMGLEFLFNSEQKLVALFMDQINHTGFNPFQGEDPRESLLDTATKAIQYAKENSIKYEHREDQNDSILGFIPGWVKLYYEGYSIHYSFEERGLGKVTIQSQENA